MIEMIRQLVVLMLEAYSISLLVYIILSYFPQTRDTRIYLFLSGLFEPVLSKLRFLSVGPISFAAIVIYILVDLLQDFILSIPL